LKGDYFLQEKKTQPTHDFLLLCSVFFSNVQRMTHKKKIIMCLHHRGVCYVAQSDGQMSWGAQDWLLPDSTVGQQQGRFPLVPSSTGAFVTLQVHVLRVTNFRPSVVKQCKASFAGTCSSPHRSEVFTTQAYRLFFVVVCVLHLGQRCRMGMPKNPHSRKKGCRRFLMQPLYLGFHAPVLFCWRVDFTWKFIVAKPERLRTRVIVSCTSLKPFSLTWNSLTE
jgi:hypothetical protein